MRIGQLKNYIIKHYFSERRKERRYGLLVLGAPGVGKSTSVEEAAREIAKRLGRTFIKVMVRWSPVKHGFVVNSEGEHGVEEMLSNPDKFFALTDFRLSTIEPSDLTGIPRSREGITFYDPLLWAVIHSTTPGILFLDELTWVQREDVWAIVPQLVLDKLAGHTKLSEDTLVVAAGNKPETAQKTPQQWSE
jgi:MoxR-like ATPase